MAFLMSLGHKSGERVRLIFSVWHRVILFTYIHTKNEV